MSLIKNIIIIIIIIIINPYKLSEDGAGLQETFKLKFVLICLIFSLLSVLNVCMYMYQVSLVSVT